MSAQSKMTREEAKTQIRKKIAFLRGCLELQFMWSESSCLPDSHLLGSLCVAFFARRGESWALPWRYRLGKTERKRSLSYVCYTNSEALCIAAKGN